MDTRYPFSTHPRSNVRMVFREMIWEFSIPIPGQFKWGWAQNIINFKSQKNPFHQLSGYKIYDFIVQYPKRFSHAFFKISSLKRHKHNTINKKSHVHVHSTVKMSSTTPPKIDLENDQSNNSEDDYMDYFAEVEVEDFDEKEQENEVNQDDGSDGEEEEEEEGELIYSGNEGDQEGSGSYQEGGGSDDSPKPVSCDESPKPISSDDTPKPISYDNESRRGDVDDDSNRRDGDDDWERLVLLLFECSIILIRVFPLYMFFLIRVIIFY